MAVLWSQYLKNIQSSDSCPHWQEKLLIQVFLWDKLIEFWRKLAEGYFPEHCTISVLQVIDLLPAATVSKVTLLVRSGGKKKKSFCSGFSGYKAKWEKGSTQQSSQSPCPSVFHRKPCSLPGLGLLCFCQRLTYFKRCHLCSWILAVFQTIHSPFLPGAVLDSRQEKGGRRQLLPLQPGAPALGLRAAGRVRGATALFPWELRPLLFKRKLIKLHRSEQLCIFHLFLLSL